MDMKVTTSAGDTSANILSVILEVHAEDRLFTSELTKSVESVSYTHLDGYKRQGLLKDVSMILAEIQSINTAIQPTFGREMTLITFGPSLNSIRNMITQQTALRIFLKECHTTPYFSCSNCTTKCIESGTIPESFRTSLSQQSVVRPKAGRKKSIDSTFSTSINAHSKRHANPGTKNIITLDVYKRQPRT